MKLYAAMIAEDLAANRLPIPRAPAWWRCPNEPPCPHAGLVHDIEEPGDPISTCCIEGCTCGHVTPEVRAAAWRVLEVDQA